MIINIIPSFAQIAEPLITTSTDKSSYIYGDTIIISGSVKTVEQNTPLTIQILDPNKDVVQIEQMYIAQDGKYTTTIKASGVSWKVDGTYTVKVQYGPPNVVVETNFQFSGSSGGVPSDYNIPPIYVKTDTTYKIGDTIVVTGLIKKPEEGMPVTLRILDSNSKLVQQDQFTPAVDGSFSRTYVATGPLWISAGTYTIIAQYGSAQKADAMFYFSKSDSMPTTDKVPPLVLVPPDMVIETINASGTTIQYKVKAIDNVDGVIKPVCDPSPNSLFKVGDTKVICFAKDSSGNSVTTSFTVTVKSSQLIIPDWIRDVAGFWCDSEIDDASFVEAIQYLIDNNVIIIQKIESDSSSAQEIPSWIKNNACWWSSGQITNKDFASGIQYLISVGIIRL